jgi:2-polyprenyl-6-methoxyphenol hydroxylase-like FAD-dependent oxidoreductase
MDMKSQTSVVIAGAGPVGLGLACELERALTTSEH